jgi:hypothetical protein
MAHVIVNTLNEINTIADSSYSTNNCASMKSDDEASNDFIFYRLLQLQWYYKTRIHQMLDFKDILAMLYEMFKIKFRVFLLAFDWIWGMIENHHVFFNNSNNPQFEPRLQFFIVLNRFGVYKNATSWSNVASVFQISLGIVGKFTKRVIVALIGTLEQKVIERSNSTHKKVIKQAIAKEHGFQDTIGMIDGIHIVLDSKPNRQGEGYFNRKSCYSIQCMIVNDDKCRMHSLHTSRFYKCFSWHPSAPEFWYMVEAFKLLFWIWVSSCWYWLSPHKNYHGTL